MSDHMEAAIQVAVEAIHEAGWTCEAHEPLGLDQCEQCATTTPDLARKTLTAALPHIRKMIAKEIIEAAAKKYGTNQMDALMFEAQWDGVKHSARIAEKGTE